MRRKKNMKKNLIILIVVAVVVGVAAFYGGMAYGKSKATPAFGQGNRAAGANFAGRQGPSTGLGRSGGSANGQIIAKDDKSITIQMGNNGGSKIVFYSASTEVSKFDKGDASDIAVGQSVMINGTANSDGSVTAQTIQIRPAMPAPANQTPQK